jgi:hypothetical protein
MTLTSKPLAAIIFTLLFGGIAFTTAMGWWTTSATKIPAVFAGGEFAGQYIPADIRGSYTFGDIERSFAVPATVLADAFGISTGDPAGYQVKDLEGLYADENLEIGTSSVRLFVAYYNGLPIDTTDIDIYLPSPAAEQLKAHGGISPERLNYLDAHTVPIDSPKSITDNEKVTIPTPLAEETSMSADVVKGKTTFDELLAWGVSPTAIENIIEAPLPATSTAIKDYCTENGLDFELVKSALQAEVDQAEQ